MIVISGCPRSGTSLMTNLIRTGLDDGAERMVGLQFMNIKPDKKKKAPKMTSPKGHQKCVKYVQENFGQRGQRGKKDVEDSVDMNPDGFWECQYTVQGCTYSFQNSDELVGFVEEKNGEKRDSICKIVSQGLCNTDPNYVNKVVFMMRHPRAVAKSQERLKRRETVKNRVVHTPTMFIHVTVVVMQWLNKYKEIPVLVMDYDELLNNPEVQTKRLFDFLGEGDASKTEGIIKPKLRRSYPEEIEIPLWKEAENVHKWFVQKKFQKAIDFSQDWKTYHNREHMKWNCVRCGEMVTPDRCEACVNNKEIRDMYKFSAEMKHMKWEEEPCFYECGMDIMGDIENKRKPLSLDESVENHSWL
jgi:hypothetical protein